MKGVLQPSKIKERTLSFTKVVLYLATIILFTKYAELMFTFSTDHNIEMQEQALYERERERDLISITKHLHWILPLVFFLKSDCMMLR
jgi:hypothetical protein